MLRVRRALSMEVFGCPVLGCRVPGCSAGWLEPTLAVVTEQQLAPQDSV